MIFCLIIDLDIFTCDVKIVDAATCCLLSSIITKSKSIHDRKLEHFSLKKIKWRTNMNSFIFVQKKIIWIKKKFIFFAFKCNNLWRIYWFILFFRIFLKSAFNTLTLEMLHVGYCSDIFVVFTVELILMSSVNNFFPSGYDLTFIYQ